MALADYNMLVFSYAIEVDATETKAENYLEVVQEAVKAYRKRAVCALAKGDATAAERDIKHAEKLEAKAKKVEAKEKAAAEPAKPSGQVTVRNGWSGPVTLTIAGAASTIPQGETKTLPTPEGSFPYEMQAGPYQFKGTINAGKTYYIGKAPTPSPAPVLP